MSTPPTPIRAWSALPYTWGSDISCSLAAQNMRRIDEAGYTEDGMRVT